MISCILQITTDGIRRKVDMGQETREMKIFYNLLEMH